MDTVRFGTGIVPADITVTGDAYSLYLTHTDGSRITVIDHYNSYNDRASIDRIEFADGTVWDKATFEAMANGGGQ